jgi:hypothetical protein
MDAEPRPMTCVRQQSSTYIRGYDAMSCYVPNAFGVLEP